MSTKFNAAFWRWFGDSKVVDSKGNPLVVYHGTLKRFSAFKDGDPPYFTSDRKYASTFSTKWDMFAKVRRRGVILECYLKIENPLLVGSDWALKYDADKAKVMRAGYDGVVYETKMSGVHFRPFLSTQIKSATGNDGTWDADDPNIRSNPDVEIMPYITVGMKALLLGNPKTNAISIKAWKAMRQGDVHHDEVSNSYPGLVVLAKIYHSHKGVTYIAVDDAYSEDEAWEVAKRAAQELDWESIFADEDIILEWGLTDKSTYTESKTLSARQFKQRAGVRSNPRKR